jgi:GNAT superfamily N-acetyltransferase
MIAGVDFNIRKAEKEDAPVMMELIYELAEFEKAPESVINTSRKIEIDGFGENPLFYALVAAFQDRVVGMSLCCFRYSTWKGKRLYLEDLIVTGNFRGRGIGKALFEETMKLAKIENCSGMNWQLLDWNTPAMDFYKKYGSEFESGWLNAQIDL